EFGRSRERWQLLLLSATNGWVRAWSRQPPGSFEQRHGQSITEINKYSKYPKGARSRCVCSPMPKRTSIYPIRRQTALSLGSSAEQRLHGLLPTHSEGDQDGRHSPQSKTTGRPLAHELGHPGTLAEGCSVSSVDLAMYRRFATRCHCADACRPDCHEGTINRT
ncbi:MAG: hypothetical protein RL756_743, partial [Pseudomonadota bacterium]